MNTSFWDVATCSRIEVYRRFRDACWWWRQKALLRRWWTYTRLYCVTSNKTVVFTVWFSRLRQPAFYRATCFRLAYKWIYRQGSWSHVWSTKTNRPFPFESPENCLPKLRNMVWLANYCRAPSTASFKWYGSCSNLQMTFQDVTSAIVDCEPVQKNFKLRDSYRCFTKEPGGIHKDGF